MDAHSGFSASQSQHFSLPGRERTNSIFSLILNRIKKQDWSLLEEEVCPYIFCFSSIFAAKSVFDRSSETDFNVFTDEESPVSLSGDLNKLVIVN